MPRITRTRVHSISGRPPTGLKHQTFDEALTGCDLFVGENGAGKTTRLISIVALVEGLAEVATAPRCPFVGELPADTGVTVTLDTGDTLTRDLSQGPRSKAHKDATSAARKLIGVPPTAWDLSDFASATEGERGSILDAVARAGGAIQAWDQAQAIERVREIHVDSLEPEVNAEAWMAPFIAARAQLTNATSGADWLKAAELWAVERQKTSNAAQKTARSHAEEVGAQAPPAAEGDPVADNARRAELYQEQAALTTARQDHARALAALERYRQEGERLDRAIATGIEEGKRLGVAIPAPDATIPADVAQRLAEATAAMDAPVPPADGSRIPKLEQAVKEAEAKLDAATEAMHKADHARDAASTADTEAGQALGKANTTAQKAALAAAAARSTVAAMLSSVGTDATCRHCSGADPLGHGAKLDEARADLEAAESKADEATSALHAASAAAATAADALRDADKAQQEAHLWYSATRQALMVDQGALASARNALATHDAQVRAARQRDLEAARAAVAREEARIARERAAHVAAEAARANALTEARARYKALVADRKAWEAAGEPTIPAEPTAERADEIARELAEIQARDAARVARQQAITAAGLAMERADAAKVEWDATRALLAAVRQARDELAAAAYQPIETAAQELLSGAQEHGLPLPYFASPSDYGAIVRGGRVPFAGLSESERRITAASLVYALAVVARNPVRLVLLDGLEVVQEDHRLPLLSALAAAQKAGKVDNVVCTMATTADEMQDAAIFGGFTVHAVERTVTATPSPVVARIAPTHATATAGSAALAVDLDDELPF